MGTSRESALLKGKAILLPRKWRPRLDACPSVSPPLCRAILHDPVTRRQPVRLTRILLPIAALLVANPAQAQRTSAYVPGAGEDWERRAPAEVGMDAALVDSAVAFAI